MSEMSIPPGRTILRGRTAPSSGSWGDWSSCSVLARDSKLEACFEVGFCCKLSWLSAAVRCHWHTCCPHRELACSCQWVLSKLCMNSLPGPKGLAKQETLSKVSKDLMLMFEFPFHIAAAFLSRRFIPAAQSCHLFVVRDFVLLKLKPRRTENKSIPRHFSASHKC